jgi:prepilin signal peptidase PulO-like enzyme (type II secretory pathway)
LNLGVAATLGRTCRPHIWLAAPAGTPARRWYDRLPIVGWLALRRESSDHGPGYWVWPLLVEVCCGLGWVGLYWWEVARGGLLPFPVSEPLPSGFWAVVHAQFLAHALLVAVLVAAALIDLETLLIPDGITVPGTLLALALATVCPWSLLPAEGRLPAAVADALSPANWRFIHLGSPRDWPDALRGFPRGSSLLVGLGCWWLWCVALMPRLWVSRYGFRRAWRYFWAKLARSPSTWFLTALGGIGSLAVVLVWCLEGPHWRGLLSALVGMVAGGGAIWIIRVIGAAALKREAMGFGDVTLMAMIGAFLGWQAVLPVFFLAPAVGAVIGVFQWLVWRHRTIPFGPFLCLAAVVVLLGWPRLWPHLAEYLWLAFSLGWRVPLLAACLAAVMFGLLNLMRLVREALTGSASRR